MQPAGVQPAQWANRVWEWFAVSRCIAAPVIHAAEHRAASLTCCPTDTVAQIPTSIATRGHHRRALLDAANQLPSANGLRSCADLFHGVRPLRRDRSAMQRKRRGSIATTSILRMVCLDNSRHEVRQIALRAGAPVNTIRLATLRGVPGSFVSDPR